MRFTSLSHRFINVNRADVPDRIDVLSRLAARLDKTEILRDHDFQFLDSLHALLEEEAAQGVRGLYAF